MPNQQSPAPADSGWLGPLVCFGFLVLAFALWLKLSGYHPSPAHLPFFLTT